MLVFGRKFFERGRFQQQVVKLAEFRGALKYTVGFHEVWRLWQVENANRPFFRKSPEKALQLISIINSMSWSPEILKPSMGCYYTIRLWKV